MATTLTSTEPRRPTTLRAAVRRLFALASNSGNETRSSVGMFDQAQNNVFQNATFTINQYGGIVPDVVTATTEQVATARGAPVSGSWTPTHQEYSDPLPSRRRESPDVYVDCLLSESLGYPLWIPSPSMSLPALHRTLGVSLGDVGVLAPEGRFESLFNIFQSPSHPINAIVGVPEGFCPFSDLQGLGIAEFIEWSAGSYISNPRMSRVNNDFRQTHDEIVLQSYVPEAAVLMIPQDMCAYKIHVTLHLRRYIQENIGGWYKFVKVTLGRDISNGDLRVVYACRKSSGFGIATAFKAERQQTTQLAFSVDRTLTGIVGCPYRWRHTGSAEFKAGPSRAEISDLSMTRSCRNQCLFVSTIDMKVSTEIWNSVEQLTIGLPVYESSHSTSGGSHLRGSSSLRSSGESDTRGSEHSSTSHRHRERVFHPSVILHDILEAMAPGLAVYMVCDDDWAPLIKSKKDMDARNFSVQLFFKKSVIEHPGMAFFDEHSNAQIADPIAPPVAITRCFLDGSRHWKATRRILESPPTMRSKSSEQRTNRLSLPGQSSGSVDKPHNPPSKLGTREKTKPWK